MGVLQDRIKSTRLQKNLTLRELAMKLGVKEATAQRYESGEIKNIKHDTVVAIANALGVSPAFLMGWDEDPAPQSETAILADSLSAFSTEELKRIAAFMEVAGQLTDEQFEKVMAFVRFVLADL